MVGQRPRKGWIYMIDPYRVSLRCSDGHQHIYDLEKPGEVNCRTLSCALQINSSRVFRGVHPHVIWTSEEFQQDANNYVQTFTAIPLTSQTTSLGLPTTYPIVNTSRNGLTSKSFALVHQICTVDGNSFKDSKGDWLNRLGQLDSKDKTEINRRLNYFLGMDNDPSEDWFRKNATPELVQKIYGYIPKEDRAFLLENLLDELQ
jgi:mRNA interferase MazF